MSTFTYIQLSDLDFPDTPKANQVFPLLAKETGATSPDNDKYRWALLVSDKNRLLHRLLVSLGFKNDGPLAPEEEPTGDWQLFYADNSSPFLPFDEAGGDERKLSQYLELDFAQSPAPSTPTSPPAPTLLRQPKSLVIKNTSIDDSVWNNNAKPDYLDIAFSVKPTDRNMHFVDTPSATEVSPGFTFTLHPIHFLSAGLPFEFPDFKISVELKSQPNTTRWAGAVILINDVVVEGNGEQSLKLGRSLSLQSIDDSLSIELDLDEPSVFQARPNGITRITLPPQFLRLRFSREVTGVYLIPGTTLDPRMIMLDIESGIVMAAAESSSNMLSRLIPANNTIPGLAVLSFSVEFELSEGWIRDETPVFSMTGTGATKALGFSKEAKGEIDNGKQAFVRVTGGIVHFKGLDFDLSDLFGSSNSLVSFSLMPARGIGFTQTPLNHVLLPLSLKIAICNDTVNLDIGISFDLASFRLKDNKIYFKFPYPQEGEFIQWVDLLIFAIGFPNQIPDSTVSGIPPTPSDTDFDGYIDFGIPELAFTKPQGTPSNHPNPILVLPGNITEAPDFDNRLLFDLDAFCPDQWPEPECDTPYYVRINGNGLSLKAKVIASHEVLIMPEDGSSRSVSMKPIAERNGLESEIVVIDNTIRAAAMFGTLEVPGTDDLVADIEVGLRQEERGQPPTIYAVFDLEKMNGAAIAQFSVGYLQMAIEDLRLAMSWNLGNNDWDLAVIVDGAISLAPKLSSTGGLDDLKKPNAMVVHDLDLLQLNKGTGNISLRLDQPVRFDCLEGMFAVTLTDLDFGWGDNFFLTCSSADFQFKQAGEFDVTIEVGGVHLEFTAGNKLKMRTPSSFGIDAIIGDAVRFRGEVGWVDDEKERYFLAGGVLSIEGLPEAATLLKIGSGIKDNGQVVPNIVIYGSMDKEVQLFSGVVAKNFGAGIGINNRLSGIGDRPNAKEMIKKINDIDPSRLEGWRFVSNNGFYLSIVGTTIIASNPGGNSVQNAYVASLVLSIDSDLNIAAAGKFWLASSVDFVKIPSNWNRPALVGAIVMLPRDQTLSAAIESQPNPAIESNKQLAKMLDKGHLTLSLLLSPDVADFHLEELSYRDNFLDIEMLFQGSFRIAMFRRAVLARADYGITGHYSNEFRGGPGGFSVRGDLALYVEYGGLLSQHGLMAYGMLDASVSFSVRAYIRIRYPKSISWKGIKYGEKRIKSDEQTLDISMYGAVAFNESAKFGFDGSFAISTSVLGHRLSISAALAINDEVIVEVRNEVAAFEEALESYKQQLLDPPTTANTLSAAAVSTEPTAFDVDTSSVSEQWRLYTFGNFHVPIPAQESQWLTPYINDELVDSNTGEAHFIFQLSKIEILDSKGVIIQQLLMPWAREHWSRIDEVKSQKNDDKLLDDQERLQELERLEEMETLLVETAVNYKQMKDECEHRKACCCEHYSVVSDPRVEGNVREYLTEEDQARLPDDVLSFNFRSLDDLLGSNRRPKGFDSDFERLVEYIYYRRQATRTERHRGRDLDEFDEIAQNRAAMLSMLHEALRSGNEDQFFRCLELNSNDNGIHQCLGSIFRYLNDEGKVKKLPDGLQIRLFRGNTHSLPLNDRKDLKPGEWILIGENDKFEAVQIAAKPSWMGTFDWLEGSTVPLTRFLRNTFTSSVPIKRLKVGKETIASLQEESSMGDSSLEVIDGTGLVSNNWYLIDDKAQSEIIQIAGEGAPDPAIIPIREPLQFSHAADIPLKPVNVEDIDVTLKRPINVHQIETNLTLPESLSITQNLRLLPPRQQYVVDSDTNKKGRVVVKLPVKFFDEFLQKRLPSFGHFQVWRQLSGESESVLIGDFLQPNLTYLEMGEFDEQRVVLVNPYLLTDEFTVSGETLQMLDKSVSEQLEIEYRLKIIPPGRTSNSTSLPWPGVCLHVPKPDPFPTSLSIVFEAQALFFDDVGKSDGSAWGRFQLASNEGEALQLASLAAKDGRKRDPLRAEDFELWAEKSDVEQIGFYSGGSTNPPTSDSSSDRHSIDPRKLRPQKRYHALEGKFLVEIKNDGETGEGTFRFVQADQFEVGTGYRFYVRSSLSLSGNRLFPVGAYLTRKSPVVRRIVRDERFDWVEPPRLRVVAQIEMIPNSVVKQIVSGEVQPLSKGDFSVNVRSPDDFTGLDPIAIRHHLGIAWDDSDGLYGGVEIQIADQDDSVLQYRQLCEVSDSEYFRTRIKQFSNPSLWILTPAERQRRMGVSDSPAPVYDGVLIYDNTLNEPESDQLKKLNKLFLITNESNPLLVNLKRRAGELISEINLLEKKDIDWHWIHFLTVTNNWMIAVRQYLGSPLNVNDEPIRNSVKQMNALITYLMLGLKVGDARPSIEMIERINQEIAEQLKSIDRADSNTIEFGVEEQARAAFMDIHLAEQCAAIIRRRQACAAEVFNSDDDQIPSFKQRFQPRDRLLPRGEKYFQLSEALNAFKANNPDAQLPLTDGFFTRFPPDKEPGNPTGEPSPAPINRAAELKDSAEKLKSIIGEIIDLTKYEDAKRERKAASIVRKAAGLTTATNHLSHLAEQQGFRLIRRPHHQLSVGADKEGEKFAEPINVAIFLPNGNQPDEPNGKVQVSGVTESAVIHYFNLLERLGFAVDCSFADSLNQLLTQQRMLDFIDQANLPQLLASTSNERYQIVVLSGREPDSEYKGRMPDAEDGRSTPYGFLGFSFIKLAVIPQSFLDLVTTLFDPESNQQKNIAEWFKIRSIVSTVQSQLTQVNEMARRVMQPLLFSTDHQYHQDELNSGAVTQGLRRVFASNAIHFSDDILVSVPKGATEFWQLKDRVNNKTYQITLEGDEFVVSLDGVAEPINISAQFNGLLGTITPGLRTMFASNNTTLSDDSLISVPNGAAKLWKLGNRVDDKSYVIKPVQAQLKILSDAGAELFTIVDQFIGLLTHKNKLTNEDGLWQEIEELASKAGIILPNPIDVKLLGSQEQSWQLFNKAENFALIVRRVDDRLLIHHCFTPEKILRIRVENRGERWVSVPSIGQRVHTSWALPSQMGHRCQVALRRVSRYEPFVRWAVGRYQPFDIPTDQAHQVEIKRIISNALGQDIPTQLPVSVYRHPSKIQFSYMLPSAGIRSLYNGISAVRTGYKGCELTWDYELIDHDIETLQFKPILNAMKLFSDESALKDLMKRQEQRPQIEQIPRNSRQSIRLFRHERLITLDDLPFFYRYRLAVQSQYDANSLVTNVPSAATPDTQRLASFMAFKPGVAHKPVPVPGGNQYQVILDLTCIGEHLTPREQLAAPPTLTINATVKQENDSTVKVSIDAHHLPDPAMGYHLYYRVAGEGKEAVYILLAELLMPWHVGYEPLDEEPLPMFRSLHAEITINDPRPRIEFGTIENGSDARPPAYQVTLTFSVTASGETELFKNKDQRFIQASREGFLSKPLALELELTS